MGIDFAACPLSSQNKRVPPNRKVLLVPILDNWPTLAGGLLVAVSEDIAAIDAARARAEALGLEDCMFVEGSADNIPWRDAFFTEAYLENESTPEVRRVVQEGGEIHEWQNKS